jgi:trehalose/maltose hydrolase-like predicted phosphorylase
MRHDDPWILQRTGPVDPADYLYLANGYLGLRVPPWGNGVGAESRSFVAGLHYGAARSQRVSDSTRTNPPLARLTNWSAIGLAYQTGNGDPQPLLPPVDPAQIQETHDLRQAVFCSVVEHPCARIEQRLLIHQAYQHLAMQELIFQPRTDLDLIIDLELNPGGGCGFVIDQSQWLVRQPSFVALQQPLDGRSGSVRYEQAVALVVGGENVQPQRPMWARVTLKPGRPLRLRRLTWVTCDADEAPNTSRRTESLRRFDELWQQHVAAWQVRWQSRAEVSDSSWQRKINVASYNLKASHRADNPHSVPAMGLASDGWNGFVFPWDACLWILPYYLLTEPALALSMLEFERTGTMLKWPRPEYYAGGEGIKMYEGGCVALAAWHYFLVTQDRAWLADTGVQLIEAACMGYARRAIYNPDLECYELRGIWPTDEFAAKDSDNDVFTNAIAQRSICLLEQACRLLDRPVPAAVRPLQGRAFWLPFDEANQRHLEYASFAQGQITRSYDGHEIKQADTNLISYPLGVPLDPEVIRNNLEYYSGRVAKKGTPEMTWGVYASVAAHLGDQHLMMRFLDEINAYMHTPMQIFHETRYNDKTVFLTGSGDLMQAVYFGCGGIEMRPGAPEFKPCVPDALGGRLTLHGLHLAGNVGRLVVEGQQVVEYDRESEPSNV